MTNGGSKSWVAETVRAAYQGPCFADCSEWLAADVEICSLRIAATQSVPIRPISELEAQRREAFPKIYSELFSTTSYESEPFVVTRIKRAILVAQTVVLTEIDGRATCIGETVGDSVTSPVNYANEFQSVQKGVRDARLTVTAKWPLEPESTPRPLVNIVLSSINNYGHWHVHNIPFLEWLRENARELLFQTGCHKLRVFCPHLDSHFGRVKLDILNRLRESVPIELINASTLDRPMHLENVIVSSTFNIDNGTNWPANFESVFRTLRNELDPSAPELIYCNRSHAGHRGIENEAELERALESVGFFTLKPGLMSYEEQRCAFSNARVIVSSHGGALTNMLYSHRRPSIVELTHPFYGPIQFTWFRHLASVIGSRHAAIVCPVATEYIGRPYKDVYFRVDTDLVLNAIKSIVSA
jgi:hypothetical protein